MKKILITSLILLAVMLTACGSASNGTQAGSATLTLSTQTELILGTLKLESTAQAVTKEQAATLLPLWTLMQKLQNNDSAAQQEKDALVDQIKQTMTSEQLKAITAMKLTMQDAMSISQGQNVTVTSTKTSGSNSSFGGDPAGGPPAGGGDPMSGLSGGPMTGSTTSTSSTQTTSAQNADQIPSGLMDVLIKLLQQKTVS